jgi:osmotically-inducible protein OsmY
MKDQAEGKFHKVKGFAQGDRRGTKPSSATTQVKMTLLYHLSTSALNTSVTTKKGVVTLGGKAGNAAELNLAGKFTNDVKGVKGVKNRLTIE